MWNEAALTCELRVSRASTHPLISILLLLQPAQEDGVRSRGVEERHRTERAVLRRLRRRRLRRRRRRGGPLLLGRQHFHDGADRPHEHRRVDSWDTAQGVWSARSARCAVCCAAVRCQWPLCVSACVHCAQCVAGAEGRDDPARGSCVLRRGAPGWRECCQAAGGACVATETTGHDAAVPAQVGAVVEYNNSNNNNNKKNKRVGAAVPDMTPRCVDTTPFGLPVVPDVYLRRVVKGACVGAHGIDGT